MTIRPVARAEVVHHVARRHLGQLEHGADDVVRRGHVGHVRVRVDQRASGRGEGEHGAREGRAERAGPPASARRRRRPAAAGGRAPGPSAHASHVASAMAVTPPGFSSDERSPGSSPEVGGADHPAHDLGAPRLRQLAREQHALGPDRPAHVLHDALDQLARAGRRSARPRAAAPRSTPPSRPSPRGARRWRRPRSPRGARRGPTRPRPAPRACRRS